MRTIICITYNIRSKPEQPETVARVFETYGVIQAFFRVFLLGTLTGTFSLLLAHFPRMMIGVQKVMRFV